MDPTLATKVVNYIAISSALAKKALDELAVHKAAQEKAASLRSDVLQSLVKTGAVAEHQKQAAGAMLASHAETMGLLKLAVTKIAEMQGLLNKKGRDLGQGVDENEFGIKQASYDSLNDFYVGRKTSQCKASDLAILRVLDSVR